MLWPGGMERQIALLVVGLLEQDVCANLRLLEQTVIIDGGCGDINVDAADCAVFMLNAIDGLNAVKIIFHGVMYRVFPRLQSQPLMPHILQCDNLPADVLLG